LNLSIVPPRLTEQSFAQALDLLRERDDNLAYVLSQYGNPPFWVREPGFASLVLIILEQQVSLASAKAAFVRLTETINPLIPDEFLRLDDATLKQIGFSRQKASYVRVLSEALLHGDLDLDGLETLDDRTARSKLTNIKGIGPWTADIYLLMALRRPDVWPRGDLALIKGYQDLHELTKTPTQDAFDQAAESWRPWRAVAARILWHYYLSRDDRSSTTKVDS
jgi:DNA-3-methyladenine glycosylase II